jgi:Leucine-rich repeat (LRR) protein
LIEWYGNVSNLANQTGLDLSNRNISALESSMFFDLPKLVKIDLYKNQLAILPLNIFSNTTRLLKFLRLSNNQFVTLPLGLFQGLSQLEILVLDFNRLSSLPEGLFQDLISLKELRLDNNELSVLPENLFFNLNQVT